jgi:small subunit ribosomal protein S16
MVKLRLTHYGRKNTPFFRIVAVDSKTKRDGGYLELLGTFNPTPAASKQNQPRVSLNKEAIVK